LPEAAGFPFLEQFTKCLSWTYKHKKFTLSMSHKLENYLRTYRKRSGLSQDEVAFLLGCRSGTKVSRYERSSRKPSLETLFAYVVVFGASGRELFAGAYQKVEKQISNRAQLLTRKVSRATPNSMATRKLQILKAITSGSGIGPDKKI
jgi:transcriptional regulator with XRE-family HTH domain